MPDYPDYEDSDEETYDLAAIERALMASPVVIHAPVNEPEAQEG